MQRSLFDPEEIDELEKQAENNKALSKEEEEIFSNQTKSVFDQHQAFLERKQKFMEERKQWRKNRK